jgi:hypothetical protein
LKLCSFNQRFNVGFAVHLQLLPSQIQLHALPSSLPRRSINRARLSLVRCIRIDVQVKMLMMIPNTKESNVNTTPEWSAQARP